MSRLNLARVKATDIAEFLSGVGVYPQSETDSQALYLAPYRCETTPTFKVNKEKNLWYDLDTFASGDIIDLGRLLYGTDDIMKVVQSILGRAAISPLMGIGSCVCKECECGGGDTVEMPIQSQGLLSYIIRRRIDPKLASKFCCEVHFSLGSKRYYGLGFRNVNGGYEVRNSFFKGTVGAKGLSLVKMGENNGECIVFKDFVDFLSYLTLNSRAGLSQIVTMDCIVLNAMSHLRQAKSLLRQYPVVTCCFDNNDAGRRAVDALAESRDGIHDVSSAYKDFKSLSDYLCRRPYCP